MIDFSIYQYNRFFWSTRLIDFLIRLCDWFIDQLAWIIYWLTSFIGLMITCLTFWLDCLTNTFIRLHVYFFLISFIQMSAVLLLHVRCQYGLAERILSERNRKSDSGLVTLWWPRQSVEHRWCGHPKRLKRSGKWS